MRTEAEQLELVTVRLDEFLDGIRRELGELPECLGPILLGCSAAAYVTRDLNAQTFCEHAYEAYQRGYLRSIGMVFFEIKTEEKPS